MKNLYKRVIDRLDYLAARFTYRNTSGLRLNRNGRAQVKAMPKVDAENDNDRIYAQELQAQGFTIIPDFMPEQNLNALRTEFLLKISDEAYNLTIEKHGFKTQSRIKKPFDNLKSVKEFLSQSETFDRVCGLIGYPCEVAYVSAMRINHIETDDKDKDFYAEHWHFDGCEYGRPRIFLSLAEQEDKNAEIFYFLDQKNSIKALRMGYWGRKKYGHSEDFMMDKKNILHENNNGEALLFDSSRILHRQVVPEKDYKDLVLLIFHPKEGATAETWANNVKILNAEQPYT